MWDPLILKGTASGQEIKEENIKFSGYRNESTPQWSKQKVNKRKAIWDSFMSALGSRRLISHSSFMFIFKIIIKQNFFFIVKDCNDSKDLKMFNREDLKHSDGFHRMAFSESIGIQQEVFLIIPFLHHIYFKVRLSIRR